jgi:ArsR family transcriptional regulator
MKKSAVIAGLAALAQNTRLDIFRLLVEAGPEGIAAGEIGRRLGLASPTLSFHLNQLRFAGLVASRRQSRSIIYRANYAAMAGLIDYLTHNCCGGRQELCAPKRRDSTNQARAAATPIVAERHAEGRRTNG